LTAAINQRNDAREGRRLYREASDSSDAKLLAFARDVSAAAGHTFDPHQDLARVVDAIRKVARDRDALLPQDLPDTPQFVAEGHRPGFIHPTAPTWDEVDRRIAELESRVRLTERRLEVAALSLHSALDPTPKSICSRLVNVWSRTVEGLIDLEMAIKEDRRRG
jgi:hypothetical protein